MLETVKLLNVYKHFLRFYKYYLLSIFIIIIISSMIYLSIYSFLYGFYFKAAKGSNFNIFALIRDFVPFDKETIRNTSIFITLVISIIFLIIKLIIGKKWYIKTFILLVCVFFHYLFTYYFIKSPSLKEVISMGQIWILPFYFFSIIYLAISVISKPFLVISAFFHSVFFLGIAIFIDLQIYVPARIRIEDFSAAILSIIILIILLIFERIPMKNSFLIYLNTITLFLIYGIAYSLLIEIELINSIFLYLKINDYLILYLAFMSLISSIAILKLAIRMRIVHWFMSKNELVFSLNSFNLKKEDLKEIIKIFTSKKVDNFVKLILLIMVFLLYIVTPSVFYDVGSNVSDLTSFTKNELIIFKINDELVEVKGVLVAIRDNTLYISNEDNSLEIISSSNFHIKSIND